MITTIDLIRHGEPEGGRRYRGQIDDPLSAKGWQQMWAAVEPTITVRCPWQKVVTSPLIRCRAFAEQLAERCHIPVQSYKNLVEIGFGCWEGRTSDEIDQHQPGAINSFYNDPVGQRPEGAETVSDFCLRISTALEAVKQNNEGKSLLIVAHAGVIRASIAAVMEIQPANIFRIKVKNASLTRIVFPDNLPPSLIFHDGTI